MVCPAASDVAKVVARAINSEELWDPTKGSIVGDKTNWMEAIQLGERNTGMLSILPSCPMIFYHY